VKPAYGVLAEGKFRFKNMKAVLDNRHESADVVTRQLLVEEGLFGECGAVIHIAHILSIQTTFWNQLSATCCSSMACE
jgi:hypothetical protein